MTMDWWYRLNGAQQEEALAKQRKRRQRALTEQRITIPNMPPARDGIAVRVWARRRKAQANPAPNWSLSMVMAWIIWRDFGRVKEMQEKGKVSGTAFSLRVARDEVSGIHVPVSVPEKAFAELSQAAQGNGSVVGYIETPDGRLDAISPQLWPRLKLVDDYRFVQSNAKHDPIFRADDVTLIWPPIDPTPWRALLPEAKALSRAYAAAEADRVTPTVVSEDSARVAEISRPKASGAKRGARPRYDWAAFGAELSRLIEFEGAPSVSADPNWTQARVEERMAQWCFGQWRAEPSRSTIRVKVSGYLASL